MKQFSILLFGICLITQLQAQKVDRSHQPPAGPAPVISFGSPEMYKLSNGMTILVVEDHNLPKVTATLFIDQGPLKEGEKAGVMGLMGQMLGEGTTSKTKAEFDEAVEQMGADVSLGSSSASASSLTRYFPKTFMLMAEAFRHPAFLSASLDKLKSQAITGLKANEKNAKAISARVVNALTFGPQHPYGEFETVESINSIMIDDIKSAYKQYITPSRSYLTFVGDIKPSEAKALAEKSFGDWTGVKLQLPKLEMVKNPPATEIDFVDVPNAVQSEISVVNLIDLKLNHPDYFPLLLANQILGGGSEGYLNKNLREKRGYTYGTFSSVGAGRFQTTFSATAAVRNEKADSAVIEILNEIKRIRTQPVSEDELSGAKALYNGAFALGLENPARTAAFASNILINDLPKDFYKTYLQKINAVTAQDVQGVATKYFNYDNTRIVVVGKGEAVSKNIELLGYPVHYYDAYAHAVQPDDDMNVSGNLPAAGDVINKYIDAVGGAEKLKSVNSMLIKGTLAVQGMNLPYVQKMMNPNLLLMEVTMNDNPLVRRVFDGKTGSNMQMGNSNAFSAGELKDAKDIEGIFPQLFYAKEGYKVEVTGSEKVSGNDAFKLKITPPSGTSITEYYDAKTGYLVKEIRTTHEGTTEVQQTIELSDYKKVNDIMVPFKMNVDAGQQQLEIDVESVTFNENVGVEDFK
jgi:predicted Zn-dependent peptidase